MEDFVHLHIHSGYSLLDGAMTIPDIVAKVAESGMSAIAITDHGTMAGAVEMQRECKKKGIKAIIGIEIYTTEDMKEKSDKYPTHHLVLLARNKQGYKNLCKLSTMAYLEGFYRKPRVDKTRLREYGEGITALSGCLKGEIPSFIISENMEQARLVALDYRDIFGGHFYLESQKHGLAEQETVSKGLEKISSSTGIPIVATNDCHYIDREKAQAQELLICLRTGKQIEDEDRMRKVEDSDEFFLKTPEEMSELFPAEQIQNTVKIASEVEDIVFGENGLLFPRFDTGGRLPHELLEKVAHAGYRKRGIVDGEDRLQRELDIIGSLGFSEYFLIIWDLIKNARNQGILVGPGRGSAAGSLVSYCMGITDINPLEHGLLFERFLNPERVSPPDIDIDFDAGRRDEVIEYIKNKYGEARVAQIATFGSINARSGIRDVSRVMGVPLNEADALAKAIPDGYSLSEALKEEVPEIKKGNNAHLINMAMSVEGLPRHASVHAAGVVVSPGDDFTDYVPLMRMQDGSVVTQFQMGDLEELGLLKLDILGLKELGVIRQTCEQAGISPDFSEPMTDKRVYDFISKGNTTGVFQLGSEGMKQTLREIEPECFEDLVAAISLFRPGPREQIGVFVEGKRNGASYPHPDLEPILSETYGVLLYQEQIMELAQKIAGFSLGKADILRKGIGKKLGTLVDELRAEFIKGAEEKGTSPELAKKLFDLIERFAGYGFNKSHAAAYAVLAYRTAWLKLNYPAYYLAGLLSVYGDDSDKVAKIITESKKEMGILLPCINRSQMLVQATDKDTVRLGLSSIKNVGKFSEVIVEEREKEGPFRSLFDFCFRCLPGPTVLDSLIRAGALDCLGSTRSSLFYDGERIRRMAAEEKKAWNPNQGRLFEIENSGREEEPESLPEISLETNLALEKSVLGAYISGHPLGNKESVAREFPPLSSNFPEGERVAVCGFVETVKNIYTRKGKPMSFLLLSDPHGEKEVVVFPDLLVKNGKIEEGEKIFVLGKINNGKILAESIHPLTRKRLILTVEPGKSSLSEAKKMLAKYPGGIPLVIQDGKDRVFIKGFWVKEDPELLEKISPLLAKAEYVG